MVDSEQKEMESLNRQRMAKEEAIREKTDEHGKKWTKVYFGVGYHFQNWLKQFIELKGGENMSVEEIDSSGFRCFKISGEKMYRIWVKENNGME